MTISPAPELTDKDLFYLERQGQIQRWYELRRSAFQTARAILSGIEVAAAEADPDWVTGTHVKGREPAGPVLFRKAWCVTDPGAPDVAFDLTCDHVREVDPGGIDGKAGKPFVGLLCSPTTEAGRRIEAHLRGQALSSDRTGWRQGSVHVIYRYMADPDWFRHLDRWRQWLAGELIAGAKRYSDAVDKAVEGAQNP